MMRASTGQNQRVMPDEGVAAFSLVLARRRQLPPQLQAALPFWALGRGAAVARAAGTGWYAAGQMPWLGIRCLPWGDSGRNQEVTPSGAHRRAAQQEIPAAFAPMLALTAASHRSSGSGAESATQQAMARMTPFLLATLAPSTAGSLTPLISPAASSSRPMPQRVAAQVSPAKRPEIIPPLVGDRSAAEPSRQPETGAGISSTAVPPRHASLADLVWQIASSPAPDAPEAGVRMRGQTAVDEQRRGTAVPPQRASLADLVWQTASPPMPNAPEAGVKMRRQPAVDEQRGVTAVPPQRASLADLVWQAASSPMPNAPEAGVRMRGQPALDEQTGVTAVPSQRGPITNLVWQIGQPHTRADASMPGTPDAPENGLSAHRRFVASDQPAVERTLPWRQQQLLSSSPTAGTPSDSVVSETVERLVERHVERVLHQHLSQRQSQDENQPAAPDKAWGKEIIDDNTVRDLSRKLQNLAEEERSRQGYLR